MCVAMSQFRGSRRCHWVCMVSVKGNPDRGEWSKMGVDQCVFPLRRERKRWRRVYCGMFMGMGVVFKMRYIRHKITINLCCGRYDSKEGVLPSMASERQNTSHS